MSNQSEKYDIVIIGAGPVGLMLSTCLARWGYKIKHIDNRPEPTSSGRADGIQPRSLDLLRNMGLKSKIMANAPARVYEVAFWDPGTDGVVRTGTWPSCPKFIDARYPFTTLLHQGYIEHVFLDDMEKNGVKVQRPWTITGFKNDGKDSSYPVEVSFAHVDTKESETVRAKYLFSGEGAHSFVRQQLKIPVTYKDPIAYVWGVMDGVVRTDFPDIKVGGILGEQSFLVNRSPDEMHNPFRCGLYHGYPSREQHGSTLHPDRFFKRPRLQSQKNGY
jgi:2-polyprenyl-6-methoxyphenol hydroxylase-like FAD-dependent oxidoreductase